MIEVALVFDQQGNTIHWHLPPGRSGGWIPDTRDLWEVLWENRDRLGGVAHTHPWVGPAWPSQTDETTFSAIERGLGKRLLWPIVTFQEVRIFMRGGLLDDEYLPVNACTLVNLDVEGLLDRSKKLEQPSLMPSQLREWVIKTADFNSKDDIADEIAIQMPSPGEVDLMNVSPQARDLRRTLLRRIQDAGTDILMARAIMLEFAESLREET